MAYAVPAEPLPRHESVVITRAPDEVRIEWTWHRPRTQRWLLYGAIGVVLTCGTGIAIAPGYADLAPLGLIIAYFAVAPAFNRTVVRLGGGTLRVRARPVPFPSFATVRVSDIAEFFVRYEGGESSFDSPGPGREPSQPKPVVCARLRSGKEVSLLHEYDRAWGREGERIFFVVQELERELASGRWTGGAA